MTTFRGYIGQHTGGVNNILPPRYVDFSVGQNVNGVYGHYSDNHGCSQLKPFDTEADARAWLNSKWQEFKCWRKV